MSTKATLALIERLGHHGITPRDAVALRTIARTLHRTSELECGDEHGRGLERDDDGQCWETWETLSGPRGRRKVRDPELLPLKRLAAIMNKYPSLGAYQQGDPRGCALYIYSKVSLRARGGRIDSMYSSIGCPVY